MSHPSTFTWLHLSDLHARTTGGWDAKRVTDALVEDLEWMAEHHQLQPDCIFFTGDAAFGSIGQEAMPDQYQRVKGFFESVRSAFSPAVPVRRLYIVPGNHDVDRNEVTADQTTWLRDPSRNLSEITNHMEKQTKQWRQYMERLLAYRNFITSYGLTHLGHDDPHLIWGDAIDIGGKRIGMAGFNTAWSCADNKDRSHLWFGGEYQAAQLIERIGPVDFTIALLHHPSNWFTNDEDPQVVRRLREQFPLMLHGHEHLDWVEVDEDRHCLISAGACYESSWMANGYSFGRLDFNKAEGVLWLRQWDKSSGWVAANKKGKTIDGVRSLGALPWLRTATVKNSNQPVSSADQTEQPLPESTSVEEHFTTKFCEYVNSHHDVLELFGCDIPRELQKHQLSVAYVSLNLATVSSSNEEMRGLDPGAQRENEPDDDIDEHVSESTSVEEALDRACAGSGRLLILGPAGAGKTTLMRWCAIEAARGVLAGPSTLVRVAAIGDRADVLAEWNKFRDLNPLGVPNSWRWKIPVLIRLRDCPDGKLPAAADLPKFLAKHLPTAPADWMTSVFGSGRALVLLDGVDEVNRDHRAMLADEIESLIKTYPDCTYVVTTRPGAVDQGWLDQLDFVEAHVELMGRRDRSEFIDRWFQSAARVIKRLRPGEDLSITADKLKAELKDRPELGVLATNPLLCAMICALYRERQDQLPETPAELTEALCQMLLHRRERETPGLKDGEHYPDSWRELQYDQKKGLLAHLAWTMMKTDGASSIAITEAESVVKQVLGMTPGRSPKEASEVTQALIERSGLLRLATDDRIDFLHNTLKEFLAAGRVVELGDSSLLAKRADDPAWQPLILFALALAPEVFSSSLVAALIKKLPRKHTRGLRAKGRRGGILSKRDKKDFASGRSKEFFLVRCRSSARQLASKHSKRIDQIAADLFPPAHMADVDALAQLGPRWLLHAGKPLLDPAWWEGWHTAHESTRCLRLLRLIGGPRAKAAFKAIRHLPEHSSQVTCEWLMGASELHPGTKLEWPFKVRNAVTVGSRMISDLGPLAAVPEIERLDICKSKVRDLDALRHFTHLTSLFANDCDHLVNIDGIANSRRLKCLVAWNCIALTSVEALQGMIELKQLYLGRCYGLRSLCDLESLPRLEELTLSACVNLDDGSLSRLLTIKRPTLRMLNMGQCTLLTDRTWKSLGKAEFPGLQNLCIGGTPSFTTESLELVAPLFDKLTHLCLSHSSRLTSIQPLAGADLTHLKSLALEGCSALVDLTPLAKADFRNLEHLRLEDCVGIKDLSPLAEASLPKLRSLDLGGCSESVFESAKLIKKRLPKGCQITETTPWWR